MDCTRISAPSGRSWKGIKARSGADLSTIGFLGILAIFLRAFSMGGGTYTGIEAVSTSMHVMREPKVQTGKRTMLYLAVSLALTASGLLLCYALFDIKPIIGQTLNATLANQTFSGWFLGGAVAFITILSEGALLMVGAQSGFAGGPSIMANMAKDSWLPRRFAALSERLTMQNGVLLMGVMSIAVLCIQRVRSPRWLSCIRSTFFWTLPFPSSVWQNSFSRAAVRTNHGSDIFLFISLDLFYV